MRVGVLASGEGSNLQAILDDVHGRDGIEVVAVASDKPDAPALQRARRAEVATEVFRGFADRESRDAAMVEWLAARGVQLVVLAGYMQLVSSPFLERFKDRVINVHPALLPAFPGLKAIEQALDYGVKVTGVTVHLVDAGVDTGPVIAQRAVALTGTEDRDAVRELIRPVEHELLCGVVRAFARGAVRRDPGHPRRVLVDL